MFYVGCCFPAVRRITFHL